MIMNATVNYRIIIRNTKLKNGLEIMNLFSAMTRKRLFYLFAFLIPFSLGLYAYNTLTGNEIESYVIQYEWNETKRIGSKVIGSLLCGGSAIECPKPLRR